MAAISDISEIQIMKHVGNKSLIDIGLIVKGIEEPYAIFVNPEAQKFFPNVETLHIDGIHKIYNTDFQALTFVCKVSYLQNEKTCYKTFCLGIAITRSQKTEIYTRIFRELKEHLILNPKEIISDFEKNIYFFFSIFHTIKKNLNSLIFFF